MTIQELISNNQLTPAMDLLLQAATQQGVKNLQNELILLKSRFNQYELEQRLGTLSFSQGNIERNRIVRSLFSLIERYGISSSNVVAPGSGHPTPNGLGVDAILSRCKQLYTKTKRRDAEKAEKIKDLKSQLEDYKEKKEETAGFDKSGRRLATLEAELKNLEGAVVESEFDRLEDFINAVNLLIEKTVPSWDDLKEAYRLCTTKGFKDGWIEQQLELRQDINEARIEVAERVEGWLDNI